MQKVYYLYQVRNLVNGKIYVGAHTTTNLDDGYMGSGLGIRRAIEKYGLENFEKTILFFFTSKEELFQKEAEIVNTRFVKREDTYNMTEGGIGGSTIGARKGGLSTLVNKKGIHALSKEERLIHNRKNNLRSQFYRKGCCYDPELQRQASLAARTPEARKKLRETQAKIQHQKGSKNSQFGSFWITNGGVNRKIKKGVEIPEGFWKGRHYALLAQMEELLPTKEKVASSNLVKGTKVKGMEETKDETKT